MHLRETALAEAKREFGRLSLILAEQAERAFEAVDLVQSSLLDRLVGSGIETSEEFRQAMAGEAIYQDLVTRMGTVPQIEALSVIDENGKLLNFSRYWPIPDVNVADRDYFQALATSSTQTTFMGQPVVNRGTGTWTIYAARKVVAANGKFLGLILASIQLSYFENFYHGVARDEAMALTLFRQDGILLARYPSVDYRIGGSFAIGGVFDRLKRSPTGNVVERRPGQIDGVDKLIAARLVHRFPIAVTVTAPISIVLATWRGQAIYLIGTAAFLEVMMIAIGLLTLRQLRAQHMLDDARAAQTEAEAKLTLLRERERIAQELHIQNLRFHVALGNMTQALGMFDASDTLIVSNRRLADMFGIAPDRVVPGSTVQTLLGSVASESNLQPSDVTAMSASFQQFKTERQPASRLRELADGRTLAVNFIPMEGDGWLVTFEDITERRQAEARIAHMAHHDALTGLPNRLLFHEKLADAVARSRRGEPSSVLCLDLDHFKSVNDTLGHPVGDALLREVTARLKNQVRETDIIARLGGDEFAVVQTNIGQPSDATSLATRLIEAVGAPYQINGHQIIIGTSIGIAVAPGDGDDADQLLKNADLALYRAKADGRCCYRFFEPQMDATMQARRSLELDLRTALAEGEFKVYYQPLMNLQTKSLTGFEALVRWFHPERGLISPADFIPLTEETGLIIPLGAWVSGRPAPMRRFGRDVRKWPSICRRCS